MNGRIYDALLGRFLSADLVVQNSGDLQCFNRYSYVQNNPLSLIDPSGFAAAVPADKEKAIRSAVRLLRGDNRSGDPRSGRSLMNDLRNAQVKASLIESPLQLGEGRTAPATARQNTKPPEIVFMVDGTETRQGLARRIAEEVIHTKQVPATTAAQRDANEVNAKVSVEAIMIAEGERGMTNSSARTVNYTVPLTDIAGNPVRDPSGTVIPTASTLPAPESTQVPVSATVDSSGYPSFKMAPNVPFITGLVAGDYSTNKTTTTTSTTTTTDASGAPTTATTTTTTTTSVPVEVDTTKTQPVEIPLDPKLFK